MAYVSLVSVDFLLGPIILLFILSCDLNGIRSVLLKSIMNEFQNTYSLAPLSLSLGWLKFQIENIVMKNDL